MFKVSQFKPFNGGKIDIQVYRFYYVKALFVYQVKQQTV